MAEFWMLGVGTPGGTTEGRFSGAQQAVRAEELGYDGIVFVDSQNLAGDCYVAMGLAAHATSRIQLGTGVTNSYTRHAAATAAAIASVQAESGGRAHLGIGRGDSALAHLGLAPHKVGPFEKYLEDLQAYLRGDEVEISGGDVDVLGMADTPSTSRIRWIGQVGEKVPVDVAATGPRVIAAAARHADRVSLSVGASVERVRWGMEVAREARAEAGLSGDLPFAAYLPLVVDDDPEVAMRIGGGRVSLFARFSTMYGTVVGPASESEREVYSKIHNAYDMHGHGRAGSAQSSVIPAEFERSFGVFGPPDYCVQRLGELVEAGVDRFIMPGALLDPSEADSRAAERFAAEVAPQLQGAQ